MIQAIVFLPLLGAILAGLITLFGAHARNPSGDDIDHGDAHGDHGAHAHAAHDDHGHDDHGHDDHGPVEPPAAGSRAAEIITTTLLLIAAGLSWVTFVGVGFGHHDARIVLLPWINSGELNVFWTLRVDTLTAVMLVVVNTVSALVHLYSIGYMHEDPNRPRFMAYLSLFTFAMLMLVTSDNLVQMFFGWEGVGLASYLLIGFWFQKPTANAAAIKAFVVNRVGDFGFSLGIFAIFALVGSTDFDTIFGAAPGLVGKTIHLFGHDIDALTLTCLLLFMGAMGKSAQFLLHTWLPDAMEGPTPVSALIHAATMVTAGVFMVARLSPLFELAPTAQAFVMLIGGTTALFAATIGLVQNDIKRIVAYSTCSQLGYMFVALGAGAYSVGIFHLFTHAFFKALLFLGSGSVIHAMHHEQDIRKMGGLWRKIPFTFFMMGVGTLALTGFPFFAGYYSKDAIIESAYVAHNPFALYAFLATVIAAGLTSFYSWRLVFKTFFGEPHDRKHYDAAHESPIVMLIPLAVLAAGSILAGFPFKELFAGHGVEEFFREALKMKPHILEEMHHIPALIGWLPFIMMVGGFLISYLFYISKPYLPVELANDHPLLYRFLLNKWYFDELYDFLFVRPAKRLGYFLWKKGDGATIDGLGPDGIAARVLDVTRGAVRLQSGYLYHYAFAMLIGVAGLITWFIFGLGGQ
ncbi:NADH-quinone oxidoreductase subunit L [Bradyrhizobium sp. U87765 SZCCT0131]|uniref:NADH-quinone oxidoreductase subunit L n=1 Tax=unclassified Bradyrhizobium TaxID=2631580 RepID=UPI001BA879F3|nr:MULTISPECIES: NADH-quinone oxidoreductase subunit L [unclassified Bradyrhizobium]MBR1220013.1 NADH-quinone oxidoreductase subunit L [Bradyrhizobium sp. U87765 SZCCT0131]MBR1263531.1 NADH-quinone oxidoreductase subunit L [Bradyrhizobium sp. U87765 SZCCT0134]MBR1309100.1 NADH-quinone oxidoreductase subunit L [Bradyrhizobium sp. U87765 SZCCT0110]MBR1323863.1 NADH-quinone oxidoreductase subunit L [Bradyrhizobium sp. U87765 SZCCT0109]MBR1349415.1 NADH-quinone oxidoreductase subunit L [Bradyrhizo